jgi:hypothetical protein
MNLLNLLAIDLIYQIGKLKIQDYLKDFKNFYLRIYFYHNLFPHFYILLLSLILPRIIFSSHDFIPKHRKCYIKNSK